MSICIYHNKPWADCACDDNTRVFPDIATGIGYPKHCHRCCRLLDLCTCRSENTFALVPVKETVQRDKRIADLEAQVESFEQLVADLTATVKSLNDRINKWPAK